MEVELRKGKLLAGFVEGLVGFKASDEGGEHLTFPKLISQVELT